MDQRIKKLWVEALRSDRFLQCRSQLSHSEGYCCLGVLEYLAFQEGVIEKFDGNQPYLSPIVAEWAGLGSANTNPQLGNHNAAWLNDHRYTFSEIANRIEEHL